jgi:Fe-S-cluster containining protein
MVFNCRQCGTCCMYLGDYIVINRQTGEFTFDCESVSTGTEFTAVVDEDKRRIFSDFSFPLAHPDACRFLRPDGDLIRCTIHRDSPAQCKFYRCAVMRIADPSGHQLGYVTGTLNLHAEDPVLRAIWDTAMRKRPKSDEEAEPWIAAFLTGNGYRVE